MDGHTDSRVSQPSGNVSLGDWDVKILPTGSDAAVIRVYCVALASSYTM
jgi:hypothetical protein